MLRRNSKNLSMHATVSIHDVMPHTLKGVRDLAALIPSSQKPKVLLLVVPGLEWPAEKLDELRYLCEAGFVIVFNSSTMCRFT